MGFSSETFVRQEKLYAYFFLSASPPFRAGKGTRFSAEITGRRPQKERRDLRKALAPYGQGGASAGRRERFHKAVQRLHEVVQIVYRFVEPRKVHVVQRVHRRIEAVEVHIIEAADGVVQLSQVHAVQLRHSLVEMFVVNAVDTAILVDKDSTLTHTGIVTIEGFKYDIKNAP